MFFNIKFNLQPIFLLFAELKLKIAVKVATFAHFSKNGSVKSPNFPG